MDKVLGSITNYQGTEIRGIQGCKVRILAVLRNALSPSVDVDAPDCYVTDEETLKRLGGVTGLDRIEVQHIDASGRQCAVRIDPRAIDLACFAHLTPKRRRTSEPTLRMCVAWGGRSPSPRPKG
jgi:hypothetical protein